ncbi:PREDICTED: placenta-expressed transcript 1 protein [Dipodomys ordii]|uniref:Placenta-expressed transcript 1 protein n=1 Tax=Dipodomys ordii TaxID=10020 RepID=A0A1S3ELQ6_DIPOR|nr:PREDICTED: placenta-expressed transcript 1 protein [Dipodomys ordii]
MAVLCAMLPGLGLFLYLGLHFSSATEPPPFLLPNDKLNCLNFSIVLNTTHLDIRVEKEEQPNFHIYTVLVPVNDQVSAVVLQALENNGSFYSRSVGIWLGASKTCFFSTIGRYDINTPNATLLRASWKIPSLVPPSQINLQVFIVNHNNTATFSSRTLDRAMMTTSTASSTSTISSTSPTTKTVSITMSKPRAKTTTASTRSLAVRAFSSPIVGAIHILFVFLISKLLF